MSGAKRMLRRDSKGSHQTVRSLMWVFALLLGPWGCTPADGGPPEVRAGNTGGEPAQVAASASPATPTAAAAPPAGHAWVIFGGDTIVAEVASTPETRELGLMYRDEVPDGTGMLFVFPDNQVRSFWMANTYVPLDVAYLDPSYRIVDIVAMEPLVTDSYQSAAPAMFALEVRQGWFADQGIVEGDQGQVVFGVTGR